MSRGPPRSLAASQALPPPCATHRPFHRVRPPPAPGGAPRRRHPRQAAPGTAGSACVPKEGGSPLWGEQQKQESPSAWARGCCIYKTNLQAASTRVKWRAWEGWAHGGGGSPPPSGDPPKAPGGEGQQSLWEPQSAYGIGSEPSPPAQIPAFPGPATGRGPLGPVEGLNVADWGQVAGALAQGSRPPTRDKEAVL